MEDIILKLCKDVLANGSNDPKVSCYKLECEQCIFCSDNRSDMFGCHENDEADIKIAKQYIKEHTPISEIERTFREVIADIKEGEVWECRSKYIQRFADGIQIYHKEKGKSTPSMLMRNNDKFKLQRKEYTFEEAFKAYEEGKEIESCIKNFKIKKLNNKPHYIYKHMSEWDYINNDDACFSIDEIQGKWYINN